MKINIKDRGRLKFIKELSLNSTNTEVVSEEDYNEIIKEWDLVGIFSTDNVGEESCICGQALKNVCIIENKITHKTCYVGTDCSDKLLEKDYTKYFKTNLNQKEFIYQVFSRTLDRYLEANIYNDFERSFLNSIHSRVVSSYSYKDNYKDAHYQLSDKQTYTYYKIFDNAKIKIKHGPVPLDLPLFEEFSLYDKDPKRVLKILDQNKDDIDTISMNPVLFSYLVYRGICTKEQYNNYYGTSKYIFKKHIYNYKESNEKLNKLLSDLKLELKLQLESKLEA